MGKGPTQEKSFELTLSERSVSNKDIGLILSKLDSQEYINRKKIWTLLEQNIKAISIKPQDANVDDEAYLFVCGPNKKCPEVNKHYSVLFFSANEITKTKRQNPLEMNSLR